MTSRSTPDPHTLDSAICAHIVGSSKRELQNVVQLLQCYLRAAELEMRAVEEPLKAVPDVKGLKAQVLERIEELKR